MSKYHHIAKMSVFQTCCINEHLSNLEANIHFVSIDMRSSQEYSEHLMCTSLDLISNRNVRVVLLLFFSSIYIFASCVLANGKCYERHSRPWNMLVVDYFLGEFHYNSRYCAYLGCMCVSVSVCECVCVLLWQYD